MRKTVKLLIFITAMVLMLCYGASTAFASEETPIDYGALFAKSDEVDGHLAEAYVFELSKSFDAAPVDFTNALSEQPIDKINMFSFYISVEHEGELESYQTILSNMKQLASEGSDEDKTLFLMQIGILNLEAAPNVNDPNAFTNAYHNEV